MTRRQAVAMGVAAAIPLPVAANNDDLLITKVIPGTDESLPAIGMGSWLTFDVARDDRRALLQRIAVVRAFLEAGGSVIDSSPMYGRSPDVIGSALERLGARDAVFSASKVWTVGEQNGIDQMRGSMQRWGIARFDLMQVHNLVGLRTHAPTLRDMKASGRVRYTGVTTSHGRRHAAVALALDAGEFDFVQFSYNIADRSAERRLLPLAGDTGTAVIVNRPFRTGALFRRVEGKPLPPWADLIGCSTWAQFMLKYVISHPAVTVAIPATRRTDHMRENMIACRGVLPDAATRVEMAAWYDHVTAQ